MAVNNIVSKYLESIDNPDAAPVLPLKPSNRFNASPTKTPLKQTGPHKNEDEGDLDKLAKQLTGNQSSTPSKTDLLKKRFESDSATVSFFRDQSKANSNNSSRNGSPVNDDADAGDETPSWAKGNYRDILSKTPKRTNGRVNNQFDTSPLKQNNSNNTPNYLASPGSATSRDSPGYEYLCRILAIKNWMEPIIQEEINQDPVELISYIRNGIHLAKLSKAVLGTTKKIFTNDSRLQFQHTDNINQFFYLLKRKNVPDLFRFELTDLYDAKNVPKVWFCLHALSYILAKTNPGYGYIEDLVDQVDFTEDEIRAANRALVGCSLPNFTSVDTEMSSTSKKVERDVQTSPIRPKYQDVATSPIKNNRSSVTNRYEKYLQETNQTEESNADTSRDSINRNASSRIKDHHKAIYNSLDYTYNPLYTPEIDDHIDNIIKVQALAKGASFRYKMFIDRILLKSYEEEFTVFCSVIRGNASRRRTIDCKRDDLIVFEDEIIQLQAIARRKLFNSKSKVDFSDSEKAIVLLQAIIRGRIERLRVENTKNDIVLATSNVIEFQTVIRRNKIHSKSSVILDNIDYIEDSVLSLQSVARRILYQRQTNNSIISGLANSGGIVQLQSLIRGNKTRIECFRVLRGMFRASTMIADLQSIARGGIARTKLCNNVLITLMGQDDRMNELFAKVRGNAIRRRFNWQKQVLYFYEEEQILPLQSKFRGILSRFKREIILDDIYTEIGSVIDLQSRIRGFKIRREIVSMFNYYTMNLDKVIRAQAMIKSKFTQRAYKSLLNMKNPPLSVIQRFASLLTDNDIDYQEEMELSNLKDCIIEKSKSNEELESQIENLDIKLSLLDKNKITVEDFIQHNNKFKLYKPSANHAAHIKNLEKLNKSSRERIELYQSMFYFLQTKPSYFIRLYKTLSVESKGSNFCKSLQNLIISLFPIKNSSIDNHSREEFFYVKFIFALMRTDIQKNSRNISDLTKAQSSFWVEFFLQINNHTYQRTHLKSFMGKIVTLLIETDEVSFESDPTVINDGIADREIKVHGYSDRPKGMTPQTAIKDPEVSAAFVENLLSLREYATSVLEVLQASLNKVPIHVRLIAREAFKLSQLQFPEKSEQQHLSVAGVIFIKHYISTILQYPENFGYLAKDPFNPELFNTKAKANLKHLSRVLLQVFSMKPFSDNFLKPLNDYITSSIDITRNFISQLIEVKDIEYEYELNDYDDIITHERPKLMMKVSEMIQIEKIVGQNIDIMAPSADDQLYNVISKLDELVNSADDLVSLTELGTITLNLNPTTKEDSLADSKVKSLLTQAKRCILYIIRIQDGDGLLELLISRIKESHEDKFRKIVASERKESESSRHHEKRRPYYRTSLGDLSTLTYRELKKMALEIILQLEGMGQLTRENSFQELLNQIAVDIKTKDDQRITRKSQLDIATKTNNKLLEKEKFLSRQLNDYNKHIEGILAQLQLRPKDKKIFNIIPVFSKQYFYHRELKKNNRLPKFGSYIYSVKKLMDQKILLDFGGLITQKFSSSSKIDFMFSCHEVGIFVIEAAAGSVTVPGAYNTISLDQLLNYQYENKQKLELFSGMVTFDAQNLTSFIFKRFYDLKKD
ncbi:hypothetical protein HYPBUDRAFT_159361 [Hyphopichia burtonii NRRL Y-1933]|uniref:Uncharacterized protein n=1 Tax=Hyphopichia burtonii NRRL Y-1933 TaxID=984485 RepID=A0A1E4RQX7_9ASCO|nr:hypothetical protein HYPBUDRAFT_159361 [Hyphopichia burtonii NRRL Y-1933]ODV69465.1 hypothetical protein HYPBUDRAFT_159361 [Hyphopichia burtonii NRRL Y-1933]